MLIRTGRPNAWRRKAAVAGLAVGLLGLLAATQVVAAVKVFPLSDPAGAPAQAKPNAIEWFMSGGDWIDHLHWNSWAGPKARGHGTYHVMHCTPSCAQGHATERPGRIVLSQIHSCSGQRYYTHGTAKFKVNGSWRKAHNLGQPQLPAGCS